MLQSSAVIKRYQFATVRDGHPYPQRTPKVEAATPKHSRIAVSLSPSGDGIVNYRSPHVSLFCADAGFGALHDASCARH